MTRGLAFNHTSLAVSLSSVADEPVDPAHLPFSEIIASQGGDPIGFAAFDRAWQFNLTNISAELIEVPSKPGPQPGESLSPDGRLAMFFRDHNLWSRSTETRRKISAHSRWDLGLRLRRALRNGLPSRKPGRLNETAKPYAVWVGVSHAQPACNRLHRRLLIRSARQK